ncbi:MAG: 16S rRNA (adenine(1518)-N(6)/adenine(1519)-N(6))-dimethyltransferase RsmA [Bacillota bacterium]
MGKAEGEGVHPGMMLKTSLGQHILTSRHALERIVQAAQLSPDDLVLEIGAGTGVLTRALASRAGKVISIELDTAFRPILHQVAAQHPNVWVVFGDALELDFSGLVGPGWKCVSNLPYYITSPLIFKLLDTRPAFRRAVLLVQKEVAARVTAAPGGKEYGVLSVMTQLRCVPKVAGIVPPGSFRPAPEVSSAILVLEPRCEERVPQALLPRVERVAKVLFSQRRKTMANALVSLVVSKERAAQVLSQAGIDPRRRPETLSPNEVCRITELLPWAE